MDPLSDPDWQALAREMNDEYGSSYAAEQLRDPDWCCRELARLGYSVSITCDTYESIKAMLGRDPAHPEMFPCYTYQLWGPRFAKRGAHQAYPCPSPQVAAFMALHFIVQITDREQRKQAEMIRKADMSTPH